jgi:lipoprotein NlpI
MKNIEVEFPSEKIIILRKFATKLVEQKMEQQKSEEEISKKVQELSKEKIGWGLFISRDRKA